MSEAPVPVLDAAAVYANELKALRAGARKPDPAALSLPPHLAAFLVLLFAVLGEPPDAGQIQALADELQTRQDLDPLMAFKARYGGCTAYIEASDRAWLREQLGDRLATHYPHLALAGAPALALQRFDDQTATLSPGEAVRGRLISALGALLAAPPARARPLGPPATPLEPPPKRGRSVWVNGKEVKVTARDEFAINATVGATVGLIAFLFVYSKLLGLTDMPIALLGGALAAAAAVAISRLPERQRKGIGNLFNEIRPYLQLFTLCVLGIGAGIWLLVTGDFGVGVLVISFCVAVLWFYMKLS